MNRKTKLILLFTLLHLGVKAQVQDFNQIDEFGNITTSSERNARRDSMGTHQEIPIGYKVWTVDSRFGDRKAALPDTLPHMFQNTIFTTGLRGEYNTLGNLGSPRINRIFIDRPETDQFIFTQPYDYFNTPIETFHFTNTLSPITNLSYNTCGDRLNGEDHFTAKFAVNAGKRLGVGFKFDYIYGRGYYDSQATSHFNYTMYGSYLGERYQAHLLLSTNQQKVTENGGITNDEYISHPENFSEQFETYEIPTRLTKTWNRNINQHVFLTHRYNVGFNRKVPMTPDEIEARKFAIEAQKDMEKRKAEEKAKKEGRNPQEEAFEGNRPTGRPKDAKIMGAEPTDLAALNKDNGRIQVNDSTAMDSLLTAEKKAAKDTAWLKDEYVPVTSFIHTVQFDNYKRIYQSYDPADTYYLNTYNVRERYVSNDSIYDQTNHYSLKNTFAISLLEGFNKWVKMGLKVFVASEFRHFTLPDSVGQRTFNEHNLSIGGQLSKSLGKALHYNVLAETWMSGEDAGQLKVDGNADFNFKLFGDTVTLAASGFFHRTNPTFYYRHFSGRHLYWDNEGLDKTIHTRIQGMLRYAKTQTSLRFAVDNISKMAYLTSSYQVATLSNGNVERQYYNVRVAQSSASVNLITASLSQNFKLGPLHWQNVVTYQKSSNENILPVPDLNVYSNLFLRMKIVKVLACDLGADVRYFTKYYAPDYAPVIGQYTVQSGENKTEVGNYPLLNVYANFKLKQARFFVMYSHLNAGSGNKNYFYTPHYPLNDSILRFGLSWTFNN